MKRMGREGTKTWFSEPDLRGKIKEKRKMQCTNKNLLE